MFSCSDDDEPRSRSQYAVLNLLPTSVTVEWNADKSTSTILRQDHYVVVGAKHRDGDTGPEVNESPLWCLRVKSGAHGTIFYSTDIPLDGYYEYERRDDNRLFYFIVDQWLIDLARIDSNCMDLGDVAEPEDSTLPLTAGERGQ